jgi:hypothetical protein
MTKLVRRIWNYTPRSAIEDEERSTAVDKMLPANPDLVPPSEASVATVEL